MTLKIRWNKPYTLEWLFFKFVPKKEDKAKELVTCDGCKHLFFYNCGEAGCDLPDQVERACLKTEHRAFREQIE